MITTIKEYFTACINREYIDNSQLALEMIMFAMNQGRIEIFNTTDLASFEYEEFQNRFEDYLEKEELTLEYGILLSDFMNPKWISANIGKHLKNADIGKLVDYIVKH